jgi:hypothetical protein
MGLAAVGCGAGASEEGELSEDVQYVVQMTNDGFYIVEERMTVAARQQILERDLAFVAQHSEPETVSEDALPKTPIVDNIADYFYREVPRDWQGPIGGETGVTREELLAISCANTGSFSAWFKVFTGTNFTGTSACFIKRDVNDYHFNIPASWALHPNWDGIHSVIVSNRPSPGVWSRETSIDGHYNGKSGTGSIANLGTQWLHDGFHDFAPACW